MKEGKSLLENLLARTEDVRIVIGNMLILPMGTHHWEVVIEDYQDYLPQSLRSIIPPRLKISNLTSEQVLNLILSGDF